MQEDWISHGPWIRGRIPRRLGWRSILIQLLMAVLAGASVREVTKAQLRQVPKPRSLYM